MTSKPFDRPWWRSAVIYQIYPRSFLDTDGDGIGDLPGITRKLDYVASLGVDGVWLSPFFTSPMADFGYDVSDYYAVDPIFGTLADFDALIARAHELDLKVIIDQVYCHTSDQHAWFMQSRDSATSDKSDWYVWADAKNDGSPPNNWQSVFSGPAWTWDTRRKQYYLHHFLKQQPTLNLHNPKVVEALVDVGKFWIERGVDGFRLDALNLGMVDRQLRDNPPSNRQHPANRPFEMQRHDYSMSQPEMIPLVERLAGEFRKTAGCDFFTVAEIGGESPHATMVDYTSGEGRLSSAYSFDFIGASTFDACHIKSVVERWSGDAQGGHPGFAFSNHDCARVATRWREPTAPAGRFERLLLLLQATLSGTIFVYQGEELGLPQVTIPFERLVDPEAIANYPNDSQRDGARTPMPWTMSGASCGFTNGEPWLPLGDAHRLLAVETQHDDPDSILNLFREVMHRRRKMSAMVHGSIAFCPAPPDTLAILRRTDNGEMAWCAINFSDHQVEIRLPIQDHGEVELIVGAMTRDGPALIIEPFSGALGSAGSLAR
jgi:alpha-glucosidase